MIAKRLGGAVSSGSYQRVSTLDQALAALASGCTILAGGTDYYPARVGRALDDELVDITALAELRGIAEEETHWRIGATTTWSELIATDLPPLFDGVRLAAREVGGMQIQNAGTLGGNLCNASPAADGVPPLLALDADVELCASSGSRRRLPLAEFVVGNRRTARAPDELLTAILVPKPQGRASGHFLKLGARRYLVISIVMVGTLLDLDTSGHVLRAGVAVGASAATARRLGGLEAAMIGRKADASLADLVREEHLEPLSPIDDVRGSAAYRRDAALTLIRRSLATLGSRT
ncbi:MAG: FAD binding domain-containing protein [Alphaproteobacteria bacterium]|nr:FAD binding domain-containing protein [Alphaproteobacteria bacterium]